MGFRILGCSGEERAQWSAYVARLTAEQRDIHFLPEYGEIYKKTYGVEPFLACWEDGNHFVIQPFVKRPLNDLPFLKGQETSQVYYDIANPYGYGGPLWQCEDETALPSLLVDFERTLCRFCKDEKIASEFSCLHPLLGNYQPLADTGCVQTEKQKDVVYIDLTPDAAALWGQIRKGHKSSIKKAEKSGVVITKVTPDQAVFEKFNQLYYETMARNSAADRWIFPSDYFQNCYECLGPERVSLHFAYYQDMVVAACILMHDFGTVYYHFSASDSSYYYLCPNNLMVYKAALWAKQEGYTRFHLGGGVTTQQDDPLFIFKSGFSHKLATLYVYSRVHDQITYDHLCRLKKDHEKSITGQESQSGYFPLYRR